jgi:uncharacterized protein YqgC (DUF456 family)
VSILLAFLGWTVFGLAILAGLALDIIGLFGNWLILVAVVIAYMVTGYEYFSIPTIVVLFVLALIGEAIEAVAASFGAKRFGGTKGTMVAALVGTIAGAIVGAPVPIIGSLVGACIGAFLGAVAYEFIVVERQMKDAMRSGFGAALGKVLGVFAKLLVGVVMTIIVVFTALSGGDPEPAAPPAVTAPAAQPAAPPPQP